MSKEIPCRYVTARAYHLLIAAMGNYDVAQERKEIVRLTKRRFDIKAELNAETFKNTILASECEDLRARLNGQALTVSELSAELKRTRADLAEEIARFNTTSVELVAARSRIEKIRQELMENRVIRGEMTMNYITSICLAIVAGWGYAFLFILDR